MKNNIFDRIAMALVISTLSVSGIGIAAEGSENRRRSDRKREKE